MISREAQRLVPAAVAMEEGALESAAEYLPHREIRARARPVCFENVGEEAVHAHDLEASARSRRDRGRPHWSSELALRSMFTEKMDRITSEFAARIIGALREASLAELASRRERAPKVKKPAAKKSPAVATKKPARKAVEKATPPDRTTTNAAIAYFAARGSKGATAEQLGAHLSELGSSAASARVIDALVSAGSIRDAGFRRSTGTGNKTTTVFIAAR